MLTKYLTEVMKKASENVKTIVLPEGEDERVLKAAHIVTEAKAAKIVILGDEQQITDYFKQNNWSMEDIKVLKPETSAKLPDYANLLYQLRKEKGMTEEDAQKTALNYNYFGTLMVKAGDADGMVSGANHSTADTVRPALQIIKSAKKDRGVSSFLILVSNNEPYLLSDCGVVINPNEKELADIALTSAETAIQFGIEPKVAMLSYSTYGSGKGEAVDKVKNATMLAKEALKTDEYKDMHIELDGELQVDAALDAVVAAKKAPDSQVAGKAKVLIFPNLEAGNIGYKLLQRLGGCEAYGPVLQGLNAPVNDLSRGAFAEDIAGVIAITCLQAQH
ncbi:MAG: phosphate acetyltransferase [Alphaproteobacteria bacterium]|nr:phosphate acetyltransferase [Alphaproteobacteria bacterium]